MIIADRKYKVHYQKNDLLSTSLKAFSCMNVALAMTKLFEKEKQTTSQYVHATARGHEAIQIALAFHLQNQDFLSPYYRDDAMLLGLGFSPETLIKQLLAKSSDVFSGGYHYYGHPSYKGEKFPNIIFQSSATGMQAIPATGIAQGIKFLETQGIQENSHAISVCSMGDGAVTNGEVSEAFQMAALKQLPILFLIQDNQFSISATKQEYRSNDAFQFAQGFSGLNAIKLDGTDFITCYQELGSVISNIRQNRVPYLVQANIPLLGHHTSGVRSDYYRNGQELSNAQSEDPITKLKSYLLNNDISPKVLAEIKEKAISIVNKAYYSVCSLPEPKSITQKVYAPTHIIDETGGREPIDGEKIYMVDAGKQAISELMSAHPEAIYIGQDVGESLGGIFREASGLAKKFGKERVMNMPIQEAYTIGALSGLSATGCKPIASIPFGDYIWTGLNQLKTELAPSCFLTKGKWNIPCIIRIPAGAYGGGGPYHSASIESVLLQIKGIKVVYPSNAADLKGLIKAAFYDPNPVVILEHKGLYWSKIPFSKNAMSIAPNEDYIVPLGKAKIITYSDLAKSHQGESMLIITYGAGVHWAIEACKLFSDQVEIIDLRTLMPLDIQLIKSRIREHGKCLILTEEVEENSFCQALAGKLSQSCFKYLDAPIVTMGAKPYPNIPLHKNLEKDMLPSIEGIRNKVQFLLNY